MSRFILTHLHSVWWFSRVVVFRPTNKVSGCFFVWTQLALVDEIFVLGQCPITP
jgi:hypothetical protein